MITEITDKIIENKEAIKQAFAEVDVVEAYDLVCKVIEFGSCDSHPLICDRLEEETRATYGGCEGPGDNTYTIHSKQNDEIERRRYVVQIYYGTCATCDALAYVEYRVKKEDRPEIYYNMCLHIAQSIREVVAVDLFDEV